MLARCATIERMRIAGLQKLTLLDYPGKTACTVFTPGCDFRCPFCHNADVVVGVGAVPASTAQGAVPLPEPGAGADGGTAAFPSDPAEGSADPADGPVESAHAPVFPTVPEAEFFAFLGKRHGLLDGVCVTGGEPTLQPDLPKFLARVKQEGFAVKLDTNGSRPDVLRALLDAGLVDAVAMDVKNAPSRYAETVGLAGDGSRLRFDLAPVEESMRLLLAGDVPFEFRTTVVGGLHTAEGLEATAAWIARLAQDAGADPADVRWFLQSFEDADSVIAGPGAFAPWQEDALKAALPRLRGFLPRTALRGVS